MRTHIVRILPFTVLLFVVSCNHPIKPLKKNEGPLDLTTTRLSSGRRVTFTYHADESYLAGLPNLEARLYYVVSRMPYASDLNMTDSSGTWSGTFTLPDTARAWALKFSSGDQIDNNKGAGYIFPMRDRSGRPVPGALIAESSFYSGLGQNFLGLKQNPDSVVTLVNRDYALHPDMKKTWHVQYFNSLIMVNRAAAIGSINRMKKESSANTNADSLVRAKMNPVFREIRTDLKQMLSRSDVSDQDYMTAYDMYKYQLKMDPEADSLEKVIMHKFPTGILAQQKMLSEIGMQKSPDSLDILYNRFKQKFHMVKKPTHMESNILLLIALTYAKAGRLDKFNQLLPQITDKQARAITCNQAAYELGVKGKDLSFDRATSQKSLDLMKQILSDPYSSKPARITKRDWLKDMRFDYGNFSDTYAMIMSKMGNMKGAVSAQKIAVEYSDGDNFGMNERYAEYLVKAGDYDSARAVIPKFIESGKFTTKMTNYLKTAYVRHMGSAEGFTDYVDSLATIAGRKMKAKLEREMIDKPAPSFDLTDLHGKKVSLASLKGKIVVVDFWATWCGPCKASFPGMQKAVNGFKNDPNVVFLFVDTGENTKPATRLKQVDDIIAKNKYTFRVLLDQKQQGMNQYQAANAYGVNGIPTKFVIGPKDHIRFKSVGYYGSSDALVREVNMMISLVKQSGKKTG